MSQVTLRDIAKKLGVSHVAVSLALRGRSGISDERRAEIKRVAQEMGYRPDPSARSLNEQKLNRGKGSIHAALAWVNFWPKPKELRSFKEFDLYWEGAFAAAHAQGYRLEEFDVNQQLSLARLQKILVTRNIRGVIVPPSPIAIDWSGFNWDWFSGVRIGYGLGSGPQSLDLYGVAVDQVGNCEIAYIRCKELGYRRIGYVTWSTSSTEKPSRFLGGFLLGQTNEPANQKVPPLFLGQHDQGEDQKKLEAWLRRYNPDGVLTELAQTRRMIEKTGRSIGKEIGLGVMSVLDGNADSGIYQNPELIGKAASEIVISLINRRQTGSSTDFRISIVRGKWVDGTSMPPRVQLT